MPLTGEEFDRLVAPWKELQPPAPWPAPEDRAARLEVEARAAAELGEAGRRAAVGLIVAVGNYEWLSEQSSVVIEKANALLDEFAEEEHSWRWG